MKVLIVEDDRAVLMVTTAYIESFGHEVISAISGEIALDIFNPAEMDLVLMDYLLPGIDGAETTRQLRKCHSEDWFPIIFLTSANDDKHLSIGLEAGADDYLCKPVSPIVLEAKIKAISRLVKMQKDLVNAHNQMEQLSYLDGLTHIYNRRGFDRAINREWSRMERDKNSLSFIMIDVDFFKKYNDHYGHQAGDDCLVIIARTLGKQLMRPADVLARYGGEEFAVLLPDTQHHGAIELAERLVTAIHSLELPHQYSTVSAHVTISLGLTTIDSKSNISIAELICSADDALYHAKTSGRNQYNSAPQLVAIE